MLKDIIQSYVNLPDAICEHFCNASKKKEASKGDLLSHPNQISRKLFFIEKGFLRGYKIVDGKDYTHHFYSENWFATDFESFLTNAHSTQFIEALTNVHYYEFDKEQLLILYDTHPELQKLGRIIAEKAYLATVDKLTAIQTLDLKKRYQDLILKNKRLFQNVPQKYIASYLGVSEQSLSRIKNS